MVGINFDIEMIQFLQSQFSDVFFMLIQEESRQYVKLSWALCHNAAYPGIFLDVTSSILKTLLKKSMLRSYFFPLFLFLNDTRIFFFFVLFKICALWRRLGGGIMCWRMPSTKEFLL